MAISPTEQAFEGEFSLMSLDERKLIAEMDYRIERWLLTQPSFRKSQYEFDVSHLITRVKKLEPTPEHVEILMELWEDKGWEWITKPSEKDGLRQFILVNCSVC